MQLNNHSAEADAAERRQERRLELQRPCRVRPATEPDVEAPGTTENISRSGMLVRLESPAVLSLLPAVGESVRIVIDLPRNAHFTPRLLECTGRVVRTAGEGGDSPQLAVEVHTMRIRGQRGRSSSRRDARNLVQ